MPSVEVKKLYCHLFVISLIKNKFAAESNLHLSRYETPIYTHRSPNHLFINCFRTKFSGA